MKLSRHGIRNRSTRRFAINPVLRNADSDTHNLNLAFEYITELEELVANDPIRRDAVLRFEAAAEQHAKAVAWARAWKTLAGLYRVRYKRMVTEAGTAWETASTTNKWAKLWKARAKNYFNALTFLASTGRS